MRYRDKIAALLALAEGAANRSSRREEVRTYHCDQCRGWHLTSRARYDPPRLYPKAERRKQPYRPPRIEEADASGESNL